MGRHKDPKHWTACPKCGHLNYLRYRQQIRQNCQHCGVAYPNPTYVIPDGHPKTTQKITADPAPIEQPPSPPPLPEPAAEVPPAPEEPTSLLDDLLGRWKRA